MALCLAAAVPAAAGAQAAVLDGPFGGVLPSLTPLVTARAFNIDTTGTLRYTLQVSTSVDFQTGIALDTTIVSGRSVVPIQITRPLPSDRELFFRLLIARSSGQPIAQSQVQLGRVPPWLRLVTPNSPSGDQFDTRRPLFVWQSAPVVDAIGPWSYELEIFTGGNTAVATLGLRDTTFRPSADLETDRSYKWSVRAYLPGGEQTRVLNRSTFGVVDPATPAQTLLFQNFPNPFPTPTAFATCFWFDLSEPGGRVDLDVLDLRGNLVRSIIPGSDGQRDFAPGRYGRGLPGAGSNCDNRFVWDGTANDGRTVAPGVYLVRFRVAGGPVTFKRMLFRGR